MPEPDRLHHVNELPRSLLATAGVLASLALVALLLLAPLPVPHRPAEASLYSSQVAWAYGGAYREAVGGGEDAAAFARALELNHELRASLNVDHDWAPEARVLLVAQEHFLKWHLEHGSRRDDAVDAFLRSAFGDAEDDLLEDLEAGLLDLLEVHASTKDQADSRFYGRGIAASPGWHALRLDVENTLASWADLMAALREASRPHSTFFQQAELADRDLVEVEEYLASLEPVEATLLAARDLRVVAASGKASDLDRVAFWLAAAQALHASDPQLEFYLVGDEVQACAVATPPAGQPRRYCPLGGSSLLEPVLRVAPADLDGRLGLFAAFDYLDEAPLLRNGHTAALEGLVLHLTRPGSNWSLTQSLGRLEGHATQALMSVGDVDEEGPVLVELRDREDRVVASFVALWVEEFALIR